MSYRVGICAAVSLLLLLTFACTKVAEDVQEATPGEAGAEKLLLPSNVTVPAEWGSLVCVTSDTGGAEWIHLWLEDEMGTIRMVPYNMDKQGFIGQARVIRRN